MWFLILEKKREKVYQNFIHIAIDIILITITYLLYTILTDDDKNEENLLGGVRYEFTQQDNFN